MDEAKKKRTNKARVVSRRTTELLNGIRCSAQEEEINDKVANLKQALGELGSLHDDVMGYLDEKLVGASDEAAGVAVQIEISKEDDWYIAYDKKVNLAIKEARNYISGTQPAKVTNLPAVKIKKLEVPKFSGKPKDFHRWKETFERYIRPFDESTKYDYLFSHTTSEAHTYVANRRDYKDAMAKLEEKYGNVHDLVATLVEEIKGLSVTRRGDLQSFETLSLHVNEFHDRLVLMGKESEVENSYILKEVESKLCPDDYQKWLESRDSKVDERTVNDLLKWLEMQTRLRRIVGHNAAKSSPSWRRPAGYNSNALEGSTLNCPICTQEHDIANCQSYLQLTPNERWERVKELRVCFLCLGRNHKRQNCNATSCDTCNGPHHPSLHKHWGPNPHSVSAVDASNACGTATKPSGPKRCFLPIVQARLTSGGNMLPVKAVLDSCSELNIITNRCCNKLKL